MMEAKERKQDETVLVTVKLRGVHAERYRRLKERYESASTAEVIRRALQDAERCEK